jgi:hypothetical protein
LCKKNTADEKMTIDDGGSTVKGIRIRRNLVLMKFELIQVNYVLCEAEIEFRMSFTSCTKGELCGNVAEVNCIQIMRVLPSA